mgnify:CR=1 FL=1
MKRIKGFIDDHCYRSPNQHSWVICNLQHCFALLLQVAVERYVQVVNAADFAAVAERIAFHLQRFGANQTLVAQRFAVQAGGPRMFGFYADLTAILAVTLLADGHSAALLPLGGAAALEGFQRAMRMSDIAEKKTEE